MRLKLHTENLVDVEEQQRTVRARLKELDAELEKARKAVESVQKERAKWIAKLVGVQRRIGMARGTE